MIFLVGFWPRGGRRLATATESLGTVGRIDADKKDNLFKHFFSAKIDLTHTSLGSPSTSIRLDTKEGLNELAKQTHMIKMFREKTKIDLSDRFLYDIVHKKWCRCNRKIKNSYSYR